MYELVRLVLECVGTSYKHSVTLEINFDCLIVQVILNSMHKYVPRLIIVEHAMPSAASSAESRAAVASAAGVSGHSVIGGMSGGGGVSLDENSFYTYSFPETAFIAVTAYQNDAVSKRMAFFNPWKLKL